MLSSDLDILSQISCMTFPAIWLFLSLFLLLLFAFFVLLLRMILCEEFQKCTAADVQIGATIETSQFFKISFLLQHHE